MRADLDPLVQADLEELERALAGEPSRFTELVADVRAERPGMRPEFAAQLDAKVDAARTAPKRRSWLAWSPAVGALAAVVVAIVLVSGGSSNSSSSSSSPGSSVAAQSAPADSAGSSSLKAAPFSAGATAPRPLSGRRVERNTDLTLSTSRDDVQSVADDVVATTQRFGGIVDSSQISTSDSQGSAVFALRVPTARLDDAVAALSKLAHVASLSQGSTDITGAFVSVADRLKDARAERAALLKALGRASTTEQVDAIKLRLRDNRSQIAALKGELNALRRRADLARVSVSVEGNGHKTGGAWTPGDAANDALRVLEVAAGVLLIGLAVAFPLVLLGGGAALVARSTRRRRRESALGV
jgi:negative regulator of sigma E activity